MPMGWVAAATVVAAGLAAYSSHQAAKKQAAATEKAAKIQAEQQQKALEAQQGAVSKVEPYLESSLAQYQNLLQHPELTKQQPGYMFRLQEGLKAAGIAPGSRYLTGAQIKAAERYGQEYASAEYQNALNQTAGLGSLASGVYQPFGSAASNIGNIYGNLGSIQGNAIVNAAAYRGAGTLGVSNAIGQGLTNLANYYAYRQQPQTTGYGSTITGQSSAVTTAPSSGYYSSDYIPPGGSTTSTPINTGYNTELGAEGTGFATY